MPENSELGRIRSELAEVNRKMASLEGTVLTDLRHLSHDIKNFRMDFGQLVNRREWDERKAVSDERFKALEDRLKKQEDTTTWAMRAITAAALGVVMSLYGLGKKVGAL